MWRTYWLRCASALEYLAIRPDGVYLDATCGLGGHTGAIAAVDYGCGARVRSRCGESGAARKKTPWNVLRASASIMFPFSTVGQALALSGLTQGTSGLLVTWEVAALC